MRHLLILLTVAMLVCPSMAFAQGGTIGLFGDQGGTSCNIPDVTTGLCNVYVVHVLTTAVTASEWAVTSPSCIRAAFLADTSPFDVYIGVSPFVPNGKSVGYGACLAEPIHVATLLYFCQGTTPCCLQSVVPHGATGAISAVDCSANLLVATGGSVRWNGSVSFPCSCPTVGTHESTWGSVKSMYQ